MLWTGIQGYTTDGMPHVGRVLDRENEWMLCGFNGGGMSIIFTTAEAVARMVGGESCEFEDTGLPELFRTSRERVMGSEEKGEKAGEESWKNAEHRVMVEIAY